MTNVGYKETDQNDKYWLQGNGPKRSMLSTF